MQGKTFEIGIVAALVLLWIPGVRVLASFWGEVEYASHGFMVPFVALWAATAHREALAALPADPPRGGLLVLACAAIASVLALGVGDPSLLGLCAAACIGLAVWALRGPDWVRTLVFPLGYLGFMIPLPHALVTPIIVKLQVGVSSVAVWILQRAGVAIYREGNVLTLPGDQTLFVAEACSGITSLITLMPIGVIIAYFTEGRLARRLMLVAAVIPIALAGNLIRVLGTVLASMRWGAGAATEGPVHEWAGVTTYVVGCFALIAAGRAMRWLWPEPDAQT